jgi:hypothetical protein
VSRKPEKQIGQSSSSSASFAGRRAADCCSIGPSHAWATSDVERWMPRSVKSRAWICRYDIPNCSVKASSARQATHRRVKIRHNVKWVGRKAAHPSSHNLSRAARRRERRYPQRMNDVPVQRRVNNGRHSLSAVLCTSRVAKSRLTAEARPKANASEPINLTSVGRVTL